jgi:hypothetical protein
MGCSQQGWQCAQDLRLEKGAMTDRVWFITGTSRGFGREWTIAALERGD